MNSTTVSTPAPASGCSPPAAAPRPLQLIDGNPPSLASSPTSASSPRTHAQAFVGLGLSTPPPSARAFKPPNRRQSSISYFPSDHVSLFEGRAQTKGKASRRTYSVGVWGDEVTAISRVKRDRRSLGNQSVTVSAVKEQVADHGALTLTEKHSDLLQFIAQKEAKCMELRSQLTVHESELAQLKKKWERIVCRGMDRAYATHPTTGGAQPPSATQANAHTAVSALIPSANAAIKEGVRLIAAGLDLAPGTPSSSRPHTPSMPHGSPVLSTPSMPISGLTTVSRTAMKVRHNTNMSTSSVSTATTSSTATTQSQRLSQSSASSLTSSLSFDECLEEEDTCTKTGPSPIPEETQELVKPVEVSPSHMTLSRRRSHESDESPRELVPKAIDVHAASQHQSHSRSQAHADGHPMSPLATPSSPMASLMTSVGKRWDEIQRGNAFTKSSKRASLLLSDVSQSIFAALASPTQPSAPSPRIPQHSKPHQQQQQQHHHHHQALVPEPKSLLEEDDEADGLGDVLLPSVLMPTPQSAPILPEPAHIVKAAPSTSGSVIDDEWNW